MKLEKSVYRVMLKGLRAIMFDRYLGDNKARVANAEKMYRNEKGELFLPAANIVSFLSAQNTQSASKIVFDRRQYKDKAAACLSFVNIMPFEIPLTRGGKPIVWMGEFDEDEASGPSGIWLHKSVARLPKGIPNVKERPCVSLPWELSFELTLFENPVIQVDEMRHLFELCGVSLGLGTYRGVYGKFLVEKWESV